MEGTRALLSVWLMLAASFAALAPPAAAHPAVHGLFDSEQLPTETPPDHKYNIRLYGAVGDGVANDTKAVLAALKAASEAVNYSSVLVPAGRFLVWPLLVEDCKNTWIEIEGAIIAPKEPRDWPQNEYYIKFVNPNNCSVVGRGLAAEIEGNGMGWWEQAGASADGAPSLIVFAGEFDGYPQPGVFNISLFNAPYAHIMASGIRMYSGPQISGVKMMSTDRGESAGVVITNASLFMENVDIDVGGVNAMIRTGYGDENRGFMRVDQSSFRRGSGFVVEMTDGLMGNISLSSLSFYDTSHGIRALGSQDGNGELAGVFCDDLYMMNVGIPFLVSNNYCPKSHKGCTKPAKGVQIEGLNFVTVSATQTSGDVGVFDCIAAKPCYITLTDVDVRPAKPGITNVYTCKNAQGYTGGTMSPESCLQKPSW